MSFKRGVSLYSYQQSQFLKELTLEQQLREVSQNLNGATGIEMVDEMSLHYPDPGEEFVATWHGWMEELGTTPVALDVGMDVLQFRDHVMTYEECADRLRHDIRLAHRLGFATVRAISVVPLDIIVATLPLAEELDVKVAREIHQPMTLEGPQVTEIVDYVERSGTRHLGLVPDFGIFQIRPSVVMLDWYERRGAQPAASAATASLSSALDDGSAAFPAVDFSRHTAGNLRADFARYLRDGTCDPAVEAAFAGVKAHTESTVEAPSPMDYTVVSEALMFSRTSTETLRQLAGLVTHCHGKFYDMTEMPGQAGEFEDVSIDYPGALTALTSGGFEGYIDSEFEGQRFFQDRTRADLRSEVDQVRRHQKMLVRLGAA